MILCRTAQCLSKQASSGCWRPRAPFKIDRRNTALLPSRGCRVISTSNKDNIQVTESNLNIKIWERDFYNQQVQKLKEWWATPRFANIKRPYSAEDVASKRGTLEQSYPSSLMARKLFDLLKRRADLGEPVHTSALFMKNRKRSI